LCKVSCIGNRCFSSFDRSVAVGIPVSRHPPHRSVHNLNRLFLIVIFINIYNNKYTLWKCGKNTILLDINAFLIHWIFHNSHHRIVNCCGKTTFFFHPIRVKLYQKIEKSLQKRILILKVKEVTMGRPKYFRANIKDQINSLAPEILRFHNMSMWLFGAVAQSPVPCGSYYRQNIDTYCYLLA
jgi:hypothetical protein